MVKKYNFLFHVSKVWLYTCIATILIEVAHLIKVKTFFCHETNIFLLHIKPFQICTRSKKFPCHSQHLQEFIHDILYDRRKGWVDRCKSQIDKVARLVLLDDMTKLTYDWIGKFLVWLKSISILKSCYLILYLWTYQQLLPVNVVVFPYALIYNENMVFTRAHLPTC